MSTITPSGGWNVSSTSLTDLAMPTASSLRLFPVMVMVRLWSLRMMDWGAIVTSTFATMLSGTELPSGVVMGMERSVSRLLPASVSPRTTTSISSPLTFRTVAVEPVSWLRTAVPTVAAVSPYCAATSRRMVTSTSGT